MSPTNDPDIIVIDASVLVSISSNEAATYLDAKCALDTYTDNGSAFIAPNVIVGEVIFALCKKLTDGVLTEVQHAKAIDLFWI